MPKVMDPILFILFSLEYGTMIWSTWEVQVCTDSLAAGTREVAFGSFQGMLLA